MNRPRPDRVRPLLQPGRDAARAVLLAGALCAFFAACAWLEPSAGGEDRSVDAVDDARLRRATEEPESWLTYGGDYGEQRYSRLDAIDEENVGDLGLAWSFELGTRRGLEATPIVVDGVIYTTGTWSVVYAIDARTGALLWRHDPEVPREMAGRVCCDVVNRGVAVYRGRVYVGVLDGRLLALDARTGEVDWSVWTVDRERPYSITMAPRIVKGRVILGNGGAEFGVRGYVSAYDAETGSLDWRFYTVPGDPAEPFEHPELEAAAKTWDAGSAWWEVGGGGTAWNAVSYDPELDLLYVGTGNGSPWSKDARSSGGGENLFVCSILALDPDTGRLVWHYQTTPATSGTSPRPRTSCSRTSRSTVDCARPCSTRPRTASSTWSTGRPASRSPPSPTSRSTGRPGSTARPGSRS